MTSQPGNQRNVRLFKHHSVYNTDLVTTKPAPLVVRVPETNQCTDGTSQAKHVSNVGGEASTGPLSNSAKKRRRKKQRYNKHRRNDKHYGNDSCYESDHDEDEYDCEEENCDENAVLNQRDSNNSEHHSQAEMHRPRMPRPDMRRRFDHHYDYYDRIDEAMDAAVRNEELHAMLAHSNNLLKLYDRKQLKRAYARRPHY